MGRPSGRPFSFVHYDRAFPRHLTCRRWTRLYPRSGGKHYKVASRNPRPGLLPAGPADLAARIAEQNLINQLALEVIQAEQEQLDRTYDAKYAESRLGRLTALSSSALLERRDGLRAGDDPRALINVSGEALGDFTTDLVFTPLPTPCRVYDSRGIAAGAFAPGESRDIFVSGNLGSGNRNLAREMPLSWVRNKEPRDGRAPATCRPSLLRRTV